MKRAVVGVLAALVLAACGGSDEPEDTATSSPSPSASTEATPDSLAACDLVAGGNPSVIDRIPGALTAVGSEVLQPQVDELLALHGTLEEAIEVAEPDLATALTALDVPFAQFEDIVNAGGGDVTLDTASVATDVTSVVQLCVDAGYTVQR